MTVTTDRTDLEHDKMYHLARPGFCVSGRVRESFFIVKQQNNNIPARGDIIADAVIQRKNCERHPCKRIFSRRWRRVLS
jgi:hypothetical protein